MKPLITSIMVMIAPWPVSTPVPVEQMPNYRAALARVDEGAKQNRITQTPGRFKAGWAKVELTPPVGTPLAGYGARDGAPSTGVHDPLFVKALAVSDGDDTAVIVGADILVVPENVADEVRKRVTAVTGLNAGAILFNATHTHSGGGGGMPGLLPRPFAGLYDPKLPALAVRAFTEAVVQAHAAMKRAFRSRQGGRQSLHQKPHALRRCRRQPAVAGGGARRRRALHRHAVLGPRHHCGQRQHGIQW